MYITVVQLIFIVVLLQALVAAVAGIAFRFPFGFVVFVVGLALHMVLNLAQVVLLPEAWPVVSLRWSFLYGPAFYLYIRQLLQREPGMPISLVHFVPWLLGIAEALSGVRWRWVTIALDLHLAVYLGLCVLEYVHALATLADWQSQPVRSLMRHVLPIVVTYAAILGYDYWARLIAGPRAILFGLSGVEVTLLLVFLLVNLMIVKQLLLPSRKLRIREIRTRGRQPGHPDAATDRERVTRLMTDQKLYRDPQLTLRGFAEAAGMSERRCSQTINAELGVRFADFVSRFRVDECRTLLIEQADASILTVALIAGFNSKTSFNVAFRKFVGMTPTEFRTRKNERE